MSYPPPPNQPAYPVPPGGPSGKPRLRGRTPLLLSVIFFVVAVALFVAGGVVLATKSFGKVNDFQRVSFTQGSGTITLDGTGKWIGYYEASNVTNSIDRIPNFQAEVTDAAGTPVHLESYGNRSDGKVDKFTYDYNGHHGAAALQFTAPAKGTYQVRVRADDPLPPDADLAFGRDITGGTVAGALLIVAGILFLIAAIVLLIVGLVKRSRHKRELANPFGGGYGGYGPPGGYPPGFGQQGFAPQGGYPHQGGYPPPGGYPPQGGYGQGDPPEGPSLRKD